MPSFSGIKCATCDARVERFDGAPAFRPLDDAGAEAAIGVLLDKAKRRDPTATELPPTAVLEYVSPTAGWVTIARASLLPGRIVVPTFSASREYLCPKCAECLPAVVRERLATAGRAVPDDDDPTGYGLGA